jgi:hypothetical protein
MIIMDIKSKQDQKFESLKLTLNLQKIHDSFTERFISRSKFKSTKYVTLTITGVVSDGLIVPRQLETIF